MTKIDEAIVLKQFQVNELSDLPKLRMIMEAQQMKPIIQRTTGGSQNRQKIL